MDSTGSGTPPASPANTAQFLRLLGAHERRLGAFVLAQVPHWNDAQEILQEVRIRLWEQFAAYDPAKDFGVWARTIAYYEILTYRKSSQRRHVPLSDEFLEAVADEARRQYDLADARAEALQKCLALLGEKDRRIIEAYYSGDDSLRIVAGRIGRSFHAARHALQRTRIALAECIERRLGLEGKT